MRLRLATALIMAGAEPNGILDIKSTPLESAISSESPSLVRLLLVHGADPGALNHYLRTGEECVLLGCLSPPFV